MKIITFFNNKGGVGKTTLSTNIASYMATNSELRVLYMDADPQANATLMLVSDEVREKIYIEGSELSTIYDYLSPIIMGDSNVDFTQKPFSKEYNRFNLDIIVGHPSLSLFEDMLSDSWNDCKGRNVGGFRRTNWLLQFKNNYKDLYDYMIIDVGPSLGALNRSILLNSDFFISPMGCDVFSLMGIKNIANWIRGWNQTYTSSYNDLISELGEEVISKFAINNCKSENYVFLGYSVQQYITKVISGERRGVKAYDKVIEQIPNDINEYFKPFIKIENTDDLNLGFIPNVFSLTPLSQVNNAPIFALKSTDGIVGNHYKMIENYESSLKDIISKMQSIISEVSK